MPIGLDYQLMLANAVTMTQTSATPLPGTNSGDTIAYDQGTALRHMEYGTGIGLAVFTSAFNAAGTETYTFDIIQSTVKALTSPDVLATTGAMAKTDARLTSGMFFLPLPPDMLTKEFVGAQFTGANTPSWTGSAFLMTRDTYQQYISQPPNYTP